MNEPSVQNSLKELLYQPHTSDEHIAMITKALLYGIERAKLNYQPKPYSSDFAEALVMSSIHIEDEELHDAITTYLQSINTDSSGTSSSFLNLPKWQIMMQNIQIPHAFEGTQWDENNSLYDLIQPLSVRQNDVATYNKKYHTFGLSSLAVVTSMHKLLPVALQD